MTTLQALTKIVIGTSSILCLQLLALDRLAISRAFETPASQFKSGFDFPDDSKPGTSQGAGSRGCENSDLAETHLVTLLIPSEELVGQVASGRPTFFWQLSKSLSVPVEFALTRQGTPEPIHKVRIDNPEAGLMAMKLPEDRPELTPNGRYMWSVTLVCNVRRPSANPIFFSWVERVPTTQTLQQNLTTATTARDRAAAYAQAGLWYDALETLAEVPESSPNYTAAQTYFQQLLADVGIITVNSN